MFTSESGQVTEVDLKDYLGHASWDLFRRLMRDNQSLRIGQAFMQVIEKSDYDRLTGTPVDPFHRDSTREVLNALEFLLEN